MLTTKDLAWAAGFLEGEGSFTVHARTNMRVFAAQVQREPLERLQTMFGGVIALRNRDAERARTGTKAKDIFHWYVYGQKAAEVAMTLYVMLSPKRQRQAAAALAAWKTAPGHWQRAKTHCKAGHEFTPDNVYSRPNSTHRQCITCRARWRYPSNLNRTEV